MEEKVDLRIRKTHRALLQTLQQLLCEKSFDAISVSELCERAQVRRATFYIHFRDKGELLTYMIQELQKEYNQKNEFALDHKNLNVYLTTIFRYFLDFLDENRDMVCTILNSNAKNAVLDIFSKQLESDLETHFRASRNIQTSTNNENLSEMAAVLCSGAVVNCAQWWITKGCQVSKEEVVKQFSLLIGST